MNSIVHFFAPQLDATQNTGNEDEDDLDFGSKSVSNASWNKFRELLKSFFPFCDTDYNTSDGYSLGQERLLKAVHTQLQERHLQQVPSLVEKVKSAMYCYDICVCVFV